MNDKLQHYVENARKKGLDDAAIRQRLLDAGWEVGEIYTALDGDDSLVPPTPSGQQSVSAHPTASGPINVVNSGFSGNGFEYMIYFLALGVVALSVGSMLHNIINVLVVTQKFSFYQDVIPTASAALVVAGPIYLGLMLRLRRKEAARAEILHDPSRRRAVQLLLLVTFIIGVAKLVAYVYNILTLGGVDGINLVAETLHATVTIGLAGGIFWKYFREQSRLE
ncbi:MAG: DUF5671 domain-containing protein [Candidatus Saccharimonadales bacterium]